VDVAIRKSTAHAMMACLAHWIFAVARIRAALLQAAFISLSTLVAMIINNARLMLVV
jgi:hypothetical protein